MSYDAIIVGSGAGGAAAAFQLAQAGVHVLLLEQGHALPKDDSTLDVDKVVRQKLFVDKDMWLDRDANRIVPQERSNLGGKTKWYGAALLRFSREEFAADADYQYLPWPFPYEELEPYYQIAEQLMAVRTFPIEPNFQKIVSGLQSRDPGWKHQPLPLGLASDILKYPYEATHFDAFASPRGLKSDAETCLLDRVKHNLNLEILTDKKVVALKSNAQEMRKISGVTCHDGTHYDADIVLLGAGALHSPRLLQCYLEDHGLANSLPCYNLIGRNYKFHLLTAMLMLTRTRQTDMLRKTTVLTHDQLPHSSVQPLGWIDGELLAPELPSIMPRRLTDMIGRRVYGFFLQTEDGSHPDNRVAARTGAHGLPLLDYSTRRIAKSFHEHRRLVSLLRRQLLSVGYLGLAKRISIVGTAHACGTLVMGNDPTSSVVDANGKVHGMDNLYVVDGSVLPRSSRVNPALTIYAWALRVASKLNVRGMSNESNTARYHSIRA